jgi:hypothetical protein
LDRAIDCVHSQEGQLCPVAEESHLAHLVVCESNCPEAIAKGRTGRQTSNFNA